MALICVGVLSSNVAQASCGDYVIRGYGHRTDVGNHAGHGHGMLDGSESQISETERQVPLFPAVPCSGPGCRSLPDSHSLPAVPPAYSGRILEMCAIMLRAPRLLPDVGSQTMDIADLRVDEGFPLQIDVPPECAGNS